MIDPHGNETTHRRFILIDPTLKDESGHNLEYARSVVGDVLDAGFEALVYAHASAQIETEELGCPLRRWFVFGHKDIGLAQRLARKLRRVFGGQGLNLVQSIKRALLLPPQSATAEDEGGRADGLSRQVADLITGLGVRGSDRLFFPNVHWYEAVKLARLLGGMRIAAEVMILLRFDPPSGKDAAESMASVGRTPNICWLADTNELASVYSNLLQAPVNRARVPINGAILRSAALSRPKPDPVVVAVLGESRREKGFHLLPDIIEQTLARDRGIVFRIQMSFNVPGGEVGISEAMSRLRRLQSPNIEMLPAGIAAPKFAQMLGESHVLLLPYDNGAYGRRSSGLLLQGLASGLWIVATGGSTAITACIEANARTSQVVVSAGTVDGYVNALVDAAQRSRHGDPPPLTRLAEEDVPAPWAELTMHRI